MKEKLLLIDGHSILFRAFYGMPVNMTAADGLHTNALYGFLMILSKMLDEERPDYMAVTFDLPAPTFRHKLYPDYKGTRSAAPDEFCEQVPVIRSLLQEMEIPVVTAEGYEADDLMGTLSLQAEQGGIETVILSGDRDQLQLVDSDVTVVIPKTKGGQTTYLRYTPAEVKEEFGVTPKEFIELKALMGDSSDNIPGLPGVGPKTAQKIMESYGSIENAYAHIDEIKPKKAKEAMAENPELLRLSKELVTIVRDAPVAFDPESFRVGNIYTPKAYESFKRLGFKSLLGRFEEISQPSEVPFEYTSVTDLSEAEEIFKEFADADDASVAVLFEKYHLYVLALAYGDRVYVMTPGGFLKEDYLLKKTADAVKKRKSFCAPDVKGLMKLLMPYLSYEEFKELKPFDSVIAAYLIDPLKSDWAMDAVSQAYLGKTIPSAKELLGKAGMAAAASGEEDALKLCALEAYTALCAHAQEEERLRETEMLQLFREIEIPLTYVLASMERKGILASREALKEYSDSLSERIDELQKEIVKDAGREFNINSPKQLGEILFGEMKLPGGKKTKSGYSTAADVLEKLAPSYPIAANVLEYRKYTKLKSTYADGLPSYIEEDGRIHTSFNQTITATGRLSSTEPNLQNIPMREELGRMIRKCFYPAEGCVFVDADYSQIELRILAHMSGDEKLIAAYAEDKDIHRITASLVFHVPFDEVTDEMRRNAKAVNFGIVYGISSFGLSQGLSITPAEARSYIERYFETYPEIKSFLDGLIASAKKNGYAVSIYGRRRPVPELKASNFAQRSFGERVAMNSPIQGSAADIMKIAMIRVFDRLKRELPEANVILQIHDEILVEVPKAYADRAEELINEEMTRAASLKVALVTDSHQGTDWYEAK
ncbi:MAG: DNA polymerase I [Lachnospiraceae bacterium]|nr:DNA polymerase I [Lachnospiraceae bacterium]